MPYLIINALAKRLLLTSLVTIVIVMLNRSAIDSDPNAVKWILAIVFTDVFAYVLGTINGVVEVEKLVQQVISESPRPNGGSDKMGEEGDHHEK